MTISQPDGSPGGSQFMGKHAPGPALQGLLSRRAAFSEAQWQSARGPLNSPPFMLFSLSLCLLTQLIPHNSADAPLSTAYFAY